MFILKKIFFYNRKYKRNRFKGYKNFCKYNIIYRNKNPENIEEIKILGLLARLKIPFYVSNNVDLMIHLKPMDYMYLRTIRN